MIDWRKVKIWKTMNDGHLWLTSTMQNYWWNLILVINVDNKNWINIDGCNHPSYSTLAMNDASATGLGKSGHCYLLQRDPLCCWLFVEECQIKETTVAFSCWLELEKTQKKMHHTRNMVTLPLVASYKRCLFPYWLWLEEPQTTMHW